MDDQITQIVRRQHSIAVSGVNPGRLDVLHDAHDAHLISIANGVSFAFHGPVQEMVEQDFVLGHVAEDVHDVVLEVLFVDDNLHALTSQDV